MKTLARSLALRAFFFWAALAGAAPSLADEAAWKRIAQGGVTVLIRHAQTEPGIGDPPGFKLGECSTQRNLSTEGRAQARRLGEAFKARGIATPRVLSSQWCRCIDTAREAFGQATPEPALNSFFGERRSAPGHTEAVRKLVAGVKPRALLVLVTHQVNMTALTGEGALQGEMLVLAPNGQLVGRISAP